MGRSLETLCLTSVLLVGHPAQCARHGRHCPPNRMPKQAMSARAATGRNPEMVKTRWEFGVSEEPRHNRFLRWRQLPDICHPVEGETTAAASRSEQTADGGEGRVFIGR